MSANDPKYDFQDGRVISLSSGEPIPEDEPVMVFRARDLFSEDAIRGYLAAIAKSPQVPLTHVRAVVNRVEAFTEFRSSWPSRLKTPDTPENLTN